MMIFNIRHCPSESIGNVIALLLLLAAGLACADVIVPEDYPASGNERPPSLRGVQNLFGPLERHGNLLYTTTPWSLDTPLQGQLNLGIRQDLAARVIDHQGDKFDFVIVLTTFPTQLALGEFQAAGLYWHIKNDVSGIGRPLTDQSAQWGSAGQLQGFIDLGQADLERLSPESHQYRHLLETAMHEIMHRWSSYVSYVDGNGLMQQDLLGHMQAHWHPLLDSHASVMYGHLWEALADSGYRSGPVRRRYSKLDMYLAGLAGPNEVGPILRLRNSQTELSDFPAAGQVVQADPELLTIDQIIDAEGPRLPDVVSSQKHFRAAVVLVSHPDEQVPFGTLAALERFRQDVQRRFSSMTHGRGVLHIVPQVDDATAPGLPEILIGSSESGTNSVDVNLALDWLEQQQSTDGFWIDRNGSRWRDTAATMEVLRLLRPDFPDLSLAETALSESLPETLESNAWRARALFGQNHDAALIAEISDLQRADGGWGLTDEHRSSVADTAGIVLAFWDAMPSDIRDAALDFLAVAQNADGGWGHQAGAGTRFPPTLSALEALSLPVSEHTDVLQQGLDWIVSAHRPTGEFRHNGEAFSSGDAARALALLIGHEVEPGTFESTTQWISRQQGRDGDWGGSAYSTARVLLLLGLLDLPNLRVIGQPFSLPEAPTEGSLARLTARVGNTGRQIAPASSLRWYLGDPRNTGEPASGAIEVPELTPGSSVLIRHLLETEGLEGEQEIWVVADDGEQIEEWTRQDNYGWFTLNLRPPPEFADLDLHPDAVVLSPATIGSIPSQVRVTGTLRNLGLAEAQGATLALIDKGVTPQQILVEEHYDVPAQGQAAFDLEFDYTGEQSGQLWLIADPDEHIPDPDRGNNEVELTLNVITGIDVALESIQLEPEGATHAGHPLTIAVDIANLGLASAPPFILAIEVLDQADNAVHSAETILSLDAQATTRRTFPWQPAAAGVYTLRAIAEDVPGDVDVGNNEIETEQTVTVAEGINLRLDPLSVVAIPEPALEGAAFNVSVIVHSDGGDASPSFSLGLFDGDPRTGGQLLGEAAHPDQLVPGDSAELTVELQPLPMRGTHTLWLKVDPYDEIEQTNSDDDLHAFEIIALSLPDLAVQTVDLTLDPAVPVEGESVTLEARIHNLGEQAAEEIRVDLYESAVTGEALVDTRTVAIVHGESLATISWSWVFGVQDETEHLRVAIDPENEIQEQTTENNSAALLVDSADGPLFTTNRYFSPNGDGVKDETLLVFRLDQAQSVTLTLQQSGEVIRRFEEFAVHPVDRGQVAWDGRDEFGDVVVDGEYLVRLVSMGEEIATAVVTVDTDRAPLIEAQQNGRLFHNQIHGFRKGDHEPIPIVDPELGVGHILMNPYSIDLATNLVGIFKTGVRTMEPVVSNAWIQARAAATGETMVPQEIAYDGQSTLAILVASDSGYEIWFTDVSTRDEIAVNELVAAAPHMQIEGFGRSGQLVLYSSDWQSGVNKYIEINPSSGLVRETDLVDSADLNQRPSALLTNGVLFSRGQNIYFAEFNGATSLLSFDETYFSYFETRTSPSGNLAFIHYRLDEWEGVALFNQNALSISDLKRVPISINELFHGCIFGSTGDEIIADNFLLGADWSPKEDRLAILDSLELELTLWAPDGSSSHEVGSNHPIEYVPQVEMEDGQLLINQGVYHSVQHMRRVLDTEQHCSFGGELPGGREFVARGKGGESTGLLWDESGTRLMFITSDLVQAVIEGTLSWFVIPGRSHLQMLNLRSGEFSSVVSDSLWPHQGHPGQSVIPEPGVFGNELHFTQPYEIPRYYWWSARRPQQRLQPSGPFQVERFWPAEAGYALVETECPDQPGVPGWRECLPVSVINLDHPTVRLQSVVGVDDLDLGGFATDRNLQAWRIDLAADDGLSPWRQIAGWTDAEIIDSRFLRWPPNVAGPVLLRLELTDLAGNRSQAFRRSLLPLDPLEPVIELLNAEPRHISPNGDGQQDAVELRYLAILAEPFRLRVLDHFGAEVFQQVISHLPDDLGEFVHLWGGESSESGVVDDGEYEIEIWHYSIPVTVDTQAPQVDIDAMVPPYLPRPSSPPGYPKIPTNGAVLQVEVSDASLWTGRLEYRDRNGTLEWFEHGGLNHQNGLAIEDYLNKEFRLRVLDSAGNETLKSVPWPGDFVVLLGVKDIEGKSRPEPAPPINPDRLNNPADSISSHGVSSLRISPQTGLELEFADLSLGGLDQLSIQFREPESETWIDYEVDLAPGRNDAVILPLDLIPGPELQVRLASAEQNLYSNILRLSMEMIREPDCFLPSAHVDYFDGLEWSNLPQDGSLIFWQAFSAPEFELRELRQIIPGQPAQILEPLAFGKAGARLYHLPAGSSSGTTVVARLIRTSGEAIVLSALLECNVPTVGMTCYQQDTWLGESLPTISPIEHAFMLMQPQLTNEVHYAEVLRSESDGSYETIDPILFGDSAYRLYLLEVAKEYELRFKVAPEDQVSERQFSVNCFLPDVQMVTYPSPQPYANAGEVAVRVGLPDPDNPEITFSHVFVELQTAGGLLVDTLVDEMDPQPIYEEDPSCPVAPILAEGRVDLSQFPPGLYRFLAILTSESGGIWEWERVFAVYAQPAAIHVQYPVDQASVCLSETTLGGMKLGIDQFLDPERLHATILGLDGHPDMVPEHGHQTIHAKAMVLDSSGLSINEQGSCVADFDTPFVSIIQDNPFLTPKIKDIEIGVPPSPQLWNGVLGLNFNVVDRAGGRSSEQRTIQIDSRIDLEETTAVPVQPWSQFQTPLLSLDGQASLREVVYQGLTHESLNVEMRVYGTTLNAHGHLIEDVEPSLTESPVAIPGPSSAVLSPAQFDLLWNGELDDGPAPDGFYYLRPVFEDTCRIGHPAGKLVEVDSTGPAITASFPVPGQTIETSLLEVAGTVTDKYFESYRVIAAAGGGSVILNESEQAVTNPGTLALADISEVDGPGTIIIQARDRLGNFSELQIPVTFAPPPPLILGLAVSPVLFGPNDSGVLDSTAINFSLATPAEVNLVIRDVSDTTQATLLTAEPMEAGGHIVEWFGDGLSGNLLADSSYRVELMAVALADLAHEAIAGHDVTIDTTAPVIEFLYPDSTYVQGLGFLEVSVNDLHPRALTFDLQDESDVTLQSGEIVLSDSLAQYGLVDLDNLDEGAYRIEVTVWDRAENQTEEALEFTIDRTPPELELNEPTQFSHLRPGEVYLITGSVEDEHLQQWELSVSPEQEDPDWLVLYHSDEAPTTVELFQWLVEQADGDYLLRFHANDRAGNENERLLNIVIDGTAPEAAISSPVDDAWTGPELEISGTADDLHFAGYRLSLARLESGEVSGGWSVIAIAEEPVLANTLATVRPSVDTGFYRLWLEAWDQAGNVVEASREFNYIAAPPSAPDGLMAEVVNQQDVHLSWVVNEPNVPLAGFHVYRNSLRLTGEVVPATSFLDPALSDGTYHYTVVAVDIAGNESEHSLHARATVRLSAPEVQIDKPVPGETVRGLYPVTGTANSDEGFVGFQLWAETQTQTELIAQSSNPVTSGLLSHFDTRAYADGLLVTLRLEASDAFGNHAFVTTDILIDNLPPQAPTGLTAEVVDGENVQLQWNAGSEPDLLGYVLYRNGEPVNWSGSLPDDLRLLAFPETDYLDEAVPDGIHDYRVFAIDQAGNISVASNAAQVELDRRPPDLVIVEPLAGHVFETSVRITAHGDDLDIEQVHFSYRREGESDWLAIGEPVVERPYRIAWTPGDIPWARYEIRALATDTGGLSDPEPPVIPVEYADLTPPQIPTDLAAIVDGVQVTLSWQPVSDGDFAGYRVFRDGDAINAEPVATAGYVDQSPWTSGDTVRVHEYRVSAIDASDNESAQSEPVDARVHRPALEQPYTPTPNQITTLEGHSAVAGVLGGTVIGEGHVAMLPNMPVFADVSFAVQDIELALGANAVNVVVEDASGNRSVPADVSVVHGLPPVPPDGPTVEVIDDVLVVDWTEHADPDVIGYRVFQNGNGIPLDEAAPTPLDASANYDDPWRALDGEMSTAWGDHYWHETSQSPYLEIQFDALVLISEVELNWKAQRHAVDFDLMGWSGGVWSPLLRIRDNQSSANRFVLDQPYRTDRLRVEVRTLTGTGLDRLGLAELDVSIRPLLGEPGWNSGTLLPGLYQVQLSAVNHLGFESERTVAVEAGVGDLEPPEPVVLTAGVDASDVLLSWSENTTDDVSHYRLVRDGDEIAQVAFGEPTAYVDQALANGTYKYVVHVISVAGIPSAASNFQTVVVDIDLPGVPEDLTVTAPVSGSALQIEWDPAPGVVPAAYRLSRALGSTGPYELIAETQNDHYLDAPLTNGQTYFYTVEALDAAGNSSGPSAPASGTAVNLTIPEPPEFHYPGMIGQVISVNEPTLTLIGQSSPGDLIDIWHGDTLLGESLATPEVALTPLNVASVTDNDNEIIPGGRWVWLSTFTGDRVVDTLSGQVLGPWTQTAYHASWDLSHGQLWRHVSADTEYEVVDLANGTSEPLPLPLDEVYFASPSPDGRWAILAGRLTFSDPVGMFRWNRESDEVELLEATSYSDFNRHTSTWSPASNLVAWVRDGHLRVLNLQTGTFDQYGAQIEGVRPAWSPDSRFIAFVNESTPNSVVQVIDIQTGSAWEPQNTFDSQQLPFWSGDGTRISLLAGDRVEVVEFPSGALLHQIELNASGDDIAIRGWQRPMEMLVSHGNDETLELMALPGWFRIDDIELVPGENPLVGFATNMDGNRSNASGELVVVLDTQALPDLAVANHELLVQPPGGMPGSEFIVNAIVRNLGASASPEVYALMLMILPDGTEYSELLPVPPLEPDHSAIIQWESGELHWVGVYDVLLEIDPLYETDEITRDNNLAQRQFVVADEVQPLLELSATNHSLLPGQPLEAQMRVVNPGPSFSGAVELAVYDEAGMLVVELGAFPIDSLAPGATSQYSANWLPDGVLAGNYRLHGRLINSFGQELHSVSIDFGILLDAQVVLTLAPEQPVQVIGSTARIQVGVNLLHSNGVIAHAGLELLAEDENGELLRQWTRNLGTLLPGYQSSETVLWPLNDIPLGTHSLRLVLSSSSLHRTAVSSMTVIGTEGVEDLTGSVAFSQSPLPLGLATSVDWQLSMPAGATGSDVTVRLSLVALPDSGTVDSLEYVVSIDPGNSESGQATFGQILGQQGDYAVVLDAWNEDEQAWNWLDSDSSVALDLTPPEITILQPNSGLILATPFALRALIVDSFSLIDEAHYRIAEDEPWEPLLETGLGDYLAVLDGLPDGDYDIELRAADSAGNTAVALPRNVVVDNTPPEILVTGVSDQAILNSPVVPEVEVADPHLDQVSMTLNGLAFESGTTVDEEGAYQLVIEATDLAGNFSQRSIHFELDFTPPSIAFVVPEEGAVLVSGQIEVVLQTGPGETVSLSRGAFESNKVADTQGLAVFEAVPLQLGENLLSAIAFDQAGNESDMVNRTVHWLTSDEALQGTILPNAEQFAAGSQVAGTVELHNGADQSLSEIDYRFRVWHEDVVTLLSEWTGTIAIPANSSTAFGWSFSSVGWPLGELTLALEILDEVEWIEIDVRTVALADVVSPELVLVAPEPDQIIGAESAVLAEALDVHSAIEFVQWSLDGGPWEPMEPEAWWPNRYRADLINLTEGKHTLTIQAVDEWGNQAESGLVPFSVDTTAPVISISGVMDGEVTNAAVTPAVTVKDVSPVTTELELNGQPFSSGTSIDEEGAYVLLVNAEDAAGNTAELQIEFVIDLTEPVVSFTHPDPGTVIVVGSLLLSGVTEAESQVHLEGPVSSVSTFANSSGVFEVPDWPLQPGTNTISAYAIDPAGNEGPAAILEVEYKPEYQIFQDRFEATGMTYPSPVLETARIERGTPGRLPGTEWNHGE